MRTEIRTLADLRSTAERVGNPWFSPSSMRYFRSRIAPGITRPEGSSLQAGYFISSEQFVPHDGEPEPRRYTVRAFRLEIGTTPEADRLTIETVPLPTADDFDASVTGFQAFPSLETARTAVRKLIREGVLPESHF